ncbi:argininosuccinate synthase [Glaciecola sp. KUL10]|nr:argininosuccinate synthase [Glaciecola sp. KUL10]
MPAKTPTERLKTKEPHTISFDIPSGDADVALIEFAKQVDLTIIFPFKKVEGVQANRLFGSFTIREGIDRLLAGTGLAATFESEGVVKIKRISIQKIEDANSSVFSKFFELLTLQGKDIVTYPDELPDIETIEVTGLRNSLHWGIELKRNANEAFDSIQAEEIGKFPDTNLAESLQRISGVSIDRAEGEGQFVTVRGFGPQFNLVQSNGRPMASDNLGREFSFDTISPELVRAITVNKTFTASQPSGGIGSTINIETAKPFASDRFVVAGSLKASYDTNSERSTPHASLFLSNSNRKLGWLLSLSHQVRQSRINEAQTDAWLLNTDISPLEGRSQAGSITQNTFIPRNYDQRVRFEKRTRTGGTAVIQYKHSDRLEMSLDYLQSDFTVKTDSTSMGHWFTPSNVENVITDENGTAISFSQQVGHATDFHSRTFDRPSSVSALGFNAKFQARPNISVDFDVSRSKASTQDTKGARNALTLIGYLNRSSYNNVRDQILPEISGFQTARDDIVDALGNVSGVSNYLDPANARSHVMLRRGWNIQDRFDQAKVDVSVFDAFDLNLEIKAGLLQSKQSKRNERWDNENNAVHCSFCGYFPEPDLPDSFQTVFDAGSQFLKGISGYQSIPNKWLRHNGEQLFDFLESNSDVNFDAVLRDNSYFVSETVNAAYLSFFHDYQFKTFDLDVTYGLRYENTRLSVNGFEADLLGLTVLDQTELGQRSSAGRPLSESSGYSNWLPSLTIKSEFFDSFIARIAVSKSLTRPTMTQLSPSLIVTTTRQGGDLRARSGSPALKPFESVNTDFSLEWYYKPLSYISLSYFSKRVSNFIVETVNQSSINDVRDPSTGIDASLPDPFDDIALFDIIQPLNGPTARVSGLEFVLQHDFSNGWGIIANSTFVDSNATLDTFDTTQKFAITGLSDSRNLVLYYEKEALQFRLSLNNRDGFLQSLVQVQGAEPTFVRAYKQLDVSASYQLNENLSVFFEGVNLTQENVLKHGRFSNQFLLAQQPGARYALGLRFKF